MSYTVLTLMRINITAHSSLNSMWLSRIIMVLTVGLIEWLELQCLQWRLSLGKTVLTKQKVFIEKLRDLNSSIGQIDCCLLLRKYSAWLLAC